MKNRRSMLFMPGNNPGMLVTADVLGADSVIYDLEDAVSLQEKDAARDLVKSALTNVPFSHSEKTVRINPTDSPYWEEDLEAIVPTGPDAIVVPKASVESVRLVTEKIDAIQKSQGTSYDIRLLLLVETAMGIATVEQIAGCSDRVDALLLGGEDLSVDLGVERTRTSKELEYARFRLTTAAHAFGLDSLDTPFTDVDDIEGLTMDTNFSRSIGFTGRLLINPRQVEDVHAIFSPKPEEIQNAQAILEAAKEAEEQGLGVFSFKGKMVDLPVIRRAENLVESAKNWGLIR